MSARFIAAATAAIITTGLLAAPASASQRVRLLGETVVPNALTFQDTTVGGLSGIDRDPKTGEYVLISDDRSALQPARFYTARIDVGANGLGVEFTGTHPFLRKDGTTYPAGAVDPEEIRVDPWTGRYTWSQEGGVAPFSLDPSIQNVTRDGKFAGELPLPNNLHVTPTTGPKPNDVLEGLTYAAAGTLVVSSVEAPLKQDGASPTVTSGALSRITVQTRTGHVVAQYAYPLEPVFASPVPATAPPGNNGISALVAADPLDPTRYLVVERAFVTGVGNKIRIYEASTVGASNVYDQDLGTAKPMSKKLLVDLADVGLSRLDNIEGITWGPRLSGGERSLILISDNNFSAAQVTQIVALAVR
ncbi:esterase-like activity of phytase family protein [Kibdelosporangium philippinense]|uniref:Esterase-like activity of phytase family protein n=1 Tax=Kibdelosporangium philippinense TaxID=211113 RepID=A0ABS8ZDH9_9PSEU|nr:esterase-like activity of phytase family protein [Kibdelosporangium philippinense]MCE7005113.1 esterase-like activity of phytase family protein [Kibdelosporangium philippinense]